MLSELHDLVNKWADKHGQTRIQTARALSLILTARLTVVTETYPSRYTTPSTDREATYEALLREA